MFLDNSNVALIMFLYLQHPKGLAKNLRFPKLKRHAAKILDFKWQVAISFALTQGIKRNAAQFLNWCSSIGLMSPGYCPMNSLGGSG